jgi:cytochrome P450
VITKLSTTISPPIRNTIVVGSAAVLLYKNRKKFIPSNLEFPDTAFSEPLPDGSLGCPFVGNIEAFTAMGDTKTGPGVFFRKQSRLSSNPRIFKFAMLGKPAVILAGMANVKKVFNKEFKLVKTGIISDGFSNIFGGKSLLFETDPERHAFLRRLVGQSMTPEQISIAMPALITSASQQIDTLSAGSDVEMEEVLTRFTLDVAWRQILGLDLKDDEVDTFNKAVNDWIGGILSPQTSLLPMFTKYRKVGRAFNYLITKIDNKLQSLEQNGPDGSTMSGMFFAKDEDDPSKRLNREELISNTLLLILAGSETAASTLTVAMLALGLNKDVFHKLKAEQQAMITKYGGEDEVMTREMLEKECPYLDAVMKEVMRIKPLATTGAMRFAEETFVVDGKQIPKGYGVAFNPYLTHMLDPALYEADGSHMDVVKGFKPERWLNDETKPTEYMPWGVGPRYCLGYNLAVAEMKIFLALFARRVDFDMTNTTPDNVEWKRISIIPKPKDGALISVQSIKNSVPMVARSTVSA